MISLAISSNGFVISLLLGLTTIFFSFDSLIETTLMSFMTYGDTNFIFFFEFLGESS